MWTTIAKVAFSVLITAIGKIPPDQWAKLGTVVTTWLQAISDKLGAGNPFLAKLDAYRAPPAKLKPPA